MSLGASHKIDSILCEQNYGYFIFTVIPCILILSEVFIHQLMHKRVALKNTKIYTKTDPTCFGAITIIRERIIGAC
jgi:hypothetical protein